MKKLIALILVMTATGLGAFEAKSGDVINAKCSNGKLKFKYIGTEDDEVVLLMDVGFKSSGDCYRDRSCCVLFKDKDGFSWHSAEFATLYKGTSNYLTWNSSLVIPAYVFKMAESTELYFPIKD